MSENIENLLEKRRDRAIAIILSVKEEECDAYLPEAAGRSIRKVVLDQINDYHELAANLLSIVGAGGVVNQAYLDKIDAIYNEVVITDA